MTRESNQAFKSGQTFDNFRIMMLGCLVKLGVEVFGLLLKLNWY